VKLPDFFIIGAAKAGTTSVHAVLAKHPDIYMPPQKEPEFFARDDLYEQGIETYSKLFKAARANQFIGEASPIYSLQGFFPDAAKRIAMHCPKAKIIYILRDPVERAYSYYVQLTKNYQNWSGDRNIHRSFEDFIFPDRHAKAAPRGKAFAGFDSHLPDSPELCLDGSRYVLQLEQYLKYFPREQICVLKFEDYKNPARRAAFFSRLTEFLELEKMPDAALFDENSRKNISNDHFRKQAELEKIDRLKARLGAVWWVKQVIPQLLRRKARHFALNFMKTEGLNLEPPAMEPETREFLIREFQQQDKALEALTGIRYY